MNYYQRTTRWFLRFGQTRQTGAIHRALTLADVDAPSATDTIHVLIDHQLRHLAGRECWLVLICGVE
jgi:hypothetical protein